MMCFIVLLLQHLWAFSRMLKTIYCVSGLLPSNLQVIKNTNLKLDNQEGLVLLQVKV